MTAVITDSFQHFLFWCRERNIKRISQKKFIDFEGEEYIPIMNKFQLYGIHLKEVETIEGVYAKEHYDLLYFAKSRIKK